MDHTIHEKLVKTMQEAKGNKSDVFLTLYREYLNPSNVPWEILRTIIEYDEQIGSDDETPAFFENNQINEIQNKCWPLLHETIQIIIRENMDDEAFYQKLYRAVFRSELFPSDEKSSAILLKMIADGAQELPYFQLTNTLEISSDEFRRIIDDIRPQLKRSIALLNRHLEMATMESSQLWNIASELDREKQIVYWAAIIGIIRQSMKRTRAKN